MIPVPRGEAEALALYGEPLFEGGPSEGWRRRNIVTLALPYPMRLAWRLDTQVRTLSVHRLVAIDLSAILRDLLNEARAEAREIRGDGLGSEGYADLTAVRLSFYGLDIVGSCYEASPHHREGEPRSAHSLGVAIDIDPGHNPLGEWDHKIPGFAVMAFTSRGWTSGGSFKRPDWGHFQRATP